MSPFIYGMIVSTATVLALLAIGLLPAPVRPRKPFIDIDTEYPIFEKWWEDHGQYNRAGGGSYEKSFAWASWLYLRRDCGYQP